MSKSCRQFSFSGMQELLVQLYAITALNDIQQVIPSIIARVSAGRAFSSWNIQS